MGDGAVGEHGHAGADRGDGPARCTTSMAAGALGRLVVARRGAHRRRRQPRCRRAPRRTTSCSRSRPRCATTRARRSSSSPRWARSPPTGSSSWPTCRSRPTARSTGTCSAACRRREVYEQQLTSSDHATEHGAHVVALALPDLMRMRAAPRARGPARLARGRRAPGRRAAPRRRRSRGPRAGCATARPRPRAAGSAP